MPAAPLKCGRTVHLHRWSWPNNYGCVGGNSLPTGSQQGGYWGGRKLLHPFIGIALQALFGKLIVRHMRRIHGDDQRKGLIWIAQSTALILQIADSLIRFMFRAPLVYPMGALSAGLRYPSTWDSCVGHTFRKHTRSQNHAGVKEDTIHSRQSLPGCYSTRHKVCRENPDATSRYNPGCSPSPSDIRPADFFLPQLVTKLSSIGIAVGQDAVVVGVFARHEHGPKGAAHRIIADGLSENQTFLRKTVKNRSYHRIGLHESLGLGPHLVREDDQKIGRRGRRCLRATLKQGRCQGRSSQAGCSTFNKSPPIQALGLLHCQLIISYPHRSFNLGKPFLGLARLY